MNNMHKPVTKKNSKFDVCLFIADVMLLMLIEEINLIMFHYYVDPVIKLNNINGVIKQAVSKQ